MRQRTTWLSQEEKDLIVREALALLERVGMRLAGSRALAALAAWTGLVWWRRRELPSSRWWLRAVVLSGPMAVLALEAGWTTTEVGRQPWIAVVPHGFLDSGSACRSMGLTC